MSVPPEFITVKRKRSTETPLHILRLESNKRHCSDDFVYQRRIEDPRPVATSAVSRNDINPIIHISKDGDENRSIRQIKTPKKPRSPTNSMPDVLRLPAQPSEAQRRFFLKRTREEADKDKKSGDNVPRQPSGILFVERCQKNRKALTKVVRSNKTPLSVGEALPVTQEINELPRRKFKKPGVSRRAVSSQDNIPPKVLVPAEVPSEDNIMRLQEWALQETEAAKPRPMRFIPKPCTRFADRHPNHKPDATKEVDIQMAYCESEDSEDSEDSYITETYVRVPAHLIKNKSGSSVGMLVLQDESDIEFFYEKDAESDVDFDDEDSNDENYYANDYPDEEEVWSDDDELEGPPRALRKEWIEGDSDDDEDDAEDRHLRGNPWTEMYM